MNRSPMALLPSALLLAGSSLLATGCNQQASTAAETGRGTVGRIAIIDLDAIAKALGRDRVILASIQQHNQQVAVKLQNIKAGLEEQIKGLQEEIQGSAEETDNDRLNAMRRSAQQRLQQEVGAAQQSSARVQQEMVVKFREEVTPFARRAALDRGMSIVMVRQPNLMLHFDPAVDITNVVIDAMQDQARSAAAPSPTSDTEAPAAPANP